MVAHEFISLESRYIPPSSQGNTIFSLSYFIEWRWLHSKLNDFNETIKITARFMACWELWFWEYLFLPPSLLLHHSLPHSQILLCSNNFNKMGLALSFLFLSYTFRNFIKWDFYCIYSIVAAVWYVMFLSVMNRFHILNHLFISCLL